MSPARSRMEQTPEPRRRRRFQITSAERGRTEDGADVPGKTLGKHSDRPAGLITSREATVRDIWNVSTHLCDAIRVMSPRLIGLS